jgi:tetratricopeptide (TPR) repeat protein
MGKERQRKSGVTIVKSTRKDLDELEKKKRTELKSYYLLKESEVVIVRYSDCIYDYVEKKSGLFFLVSEDKMFFQTMRATLHVELGLDMELIRSASSVQKAVGQIEDLVRRGRKPVVLIEHVLHNEPTVRAVKWLKETFRDLPVIILSLEVSGHSLAQFHEAGADNFITKPCSPNVLVEKLAFTVEPQSEFQALVRQGKDFLEYNDFENALDTAQVILSMKPNSAVGYMIMGDALKGLARRQEALEAYKAAEAGADMYLEPLKRILDFYEEEGDEKGMLEYLRKLDKISPNHLERKLSLGKLLIKRGQAETAQRHLTAALDLATQEGAAKVSAVDLEIAEQYLNVDAAVSEQYFRSSISAARNAPGELKPLLFNRLGLALRKQGKWQEAVKEYQEAEKLSPEDENIQYNMAMALAEGKDWLAAAERLDRALAINPDFYKDHKMVGYNMGAIYTQAGLPRKARPLLEHVRDIAPGFKDVDRLLAELP